MINKDRVAELRDEVGPDDLEEVVLMFCEEVEETLNRISRTEEHSVEEELHFLKGSALNIGLTEVGKLCQEAEVELRHNPAAQPDIKSISEAFRSSRTKLISEL